MPRVHIYLQDVEEAEQLEELEEWEQIVGVRSADERQIAQQRSSENQNRKRSARGSVDALMDRRHERRKAVRRGGKRI